MPRRRDGLVPVMLALLVLTTGCLGLLTGSEPAVFTASPVGVDEAALDQTDFQPEDRRTDWLNRSVTVAGQEREVRVQNHVATYQRPPSVGADAGITFGLFVVASTPQAQIAGQALNPIGGMSDRELIEQLAGGAVQMRDVSREDQRTLTVLGSEAEVVRFAAVVERSGQSVPVYVEVTRVTDGDDFVIAVGAYPQATASEVRPGVTTLFEETTH